MFAVISLRFIKLRHPDSVNNYWSFKIIPVLNFYVDMRILKRVINIFYGKM